MCLSKQEEAGNIIHVTHMSIIYGNEDLHLLYLGSIFRTGFILIVKILLRKCKKTETLFNSNHISFK